MLYTAFLLGLMGSLHCVGMCGPIAFMLPVDRSSNIKQFGQIGIYHLGRLLAYSIIGLVFGALGKSLQLFGMQQKLSIIVGVLMIVLVLVPLKKTQRYRVLKPFYTLFYKLKSTLGAAFKKKTPDAFLTIGFLNGFLPCGLVYMAVFGALAMESLSYGALYMLLFGLGTIPLLSSAIYFSGLLKSATRYRIRKLVPLLVILIGALFILRGMGLGIPYLSPEPITEVVSANMECVQP